ncbi:peptide-methionine (S)-S-oxide reductase MsrA [Sulfuricurvum sp. RIFCSPLOWO2_12_FULL_43_24]|uniref:peptide-methionine (S)-S-oxide reductase MsrA n=1 Tax=Sulfuricurvum sp. RIFCSPLOWO2_12_FULL_43_24 TaxID=1802247 RepID=UPI0008BD7325|nr:peptide-methionine (S)-S-oxide reductase MsrA [Sulfuricurvum sp. RIFCSPLOWO2_12_FULL_43_24]OHD84263.1 MAG: peptide-methionine (S)-S-oxide reductase [Sulfuricurvum sp. RIFCSPLOWO2_02_43_6]OHD85415.1 MAG: peptide-methionine (S)-S-oxide reductase [Sulfuricurvum sp. RIFCSPLOWO2_02_FULL_43_45]OHD90041.1 MAG: peptide-methionine (S)-S-oxide reductase [Sulfuricurvum sp. RIFCSPLOWO2_12_FULL_43_24]
MEKALLGGGCFWCIEAVYNRVNGVQSAISGYAGGARRDPSYEQVCSGATGHAEVVEITYDPALITYEEILDIFWAIHNPTTLNSQGADRGTQYRSVIYYYNDVQKEKAVVSIAKAQKEWEDPIVTELSSAPEFFAAEGYHQNYYTEHPTQGYCYAVIAPKIQKFMVKFGDKVKG